MLQIYNSMTKQKEVFTPIKPNHVGLYVCGVTVYDYCHIGHARTYVAFDVIIRYLKWRGFTVKYVRNITDIDDKIIKRAADNGQTPEQLTDRFTQIMHEEFVALGIQKPDVEPKATGTIPQMIEMIQILIDKGFAYAADNNDVYYRIAKFKDYGKLSGQKLEQLRVGERVEANPHKEDPLDFVLWKASKPDEPQWNSPWGAGRPGWHLECSCMSKSILGDQFDIHGGGSDLRFPHHENEIAQSEAANDCIMANYWVHTGMVQINAEKMSKSLGNFFIIRDVLEQYPAEVVRFFLISGHYRSEINYSDENLNAAQASLQRLYTALRGLPDAKAPQNEQYSARFIEVMDDDFNVPEALAVLFELAREINRLKDAGDLVAAAQYGTLLKQLSAVVGILQQDPNAMLQGGAADAAKIEALIAKRNQARANKDWAVADTVRDELVAMGIELEDTANGTIWRKK